MIPVAAGTLTFTTIALATPDSAGPLAMTSEWSTSFISPGLLLSEVAPPTGTISLTANPADTNTITLSDGYSIVTFEFDNNAAVTAGNVLVTLGASAALTMTALLAAITNSGLHLSWTAGVTSPTNTLFTLTSPTGGVVPTWSRVGANITIAGMTLGTPAPFRSWIQCWVENGTDKDLDFATLLAVTSNDAATVLAAAKQYLLVKLAANDRFVWEFPPGKPLPGPIYVRGTTADPTSGGLRYGGLAE